MANQQQRKGVARAVAPTADARAGSSAAGTSAPRAKAPATRAKSPARATHGGMNAWTASGRSLVQKNRS